MHLHLPAWKAKIESEGAKRANDSAEQLKADEQSTRAKLDKLLETGQDATIDAITYKFALADLRIIEKAQEIQHSEKLRKQ